MTKARALAQRRTSTSHSGMKARSWQGVWGRALRLAQAENLRALQVDERTKAALTPEFLALKFQRQDGLASAQVREVKALVDYNSSIARLFRAMGVGLQMNRIEVRIDDSTPLKSAASVEDPGGGE